MGLKKQKSHSHTTFTSIETLSHSHKMLLCKMVLRWLKTSLTFTQNALAFMQNALIKHSHSPKRSHTHTKCLRSTWRILRASLPETSLPSPKTRRTIRSIPLACYADTHDLLKKSNKQPQINRVWCPNILNRVQILTHLTVKTRLYMNK